MGSRVLTPFGHPRVTGRKGSKNTHAYHDMLNKLPLAAGRQMTERRKSIIFAITS